MAQRDLSTFNSVSQQVVENPSGLADVAIEIGEQIITRSQEAKINENLSKAQLGLSALDNQFRIDNEGAPFDPQKNAEYKQARKELFNTTSEGISPIFRRQWNEKTNALANRSDIGQQAWAFKQAHVNTINSFNTSIENSLLLAEENGRRFGSGDITDFENLLDFKTARDNLEGSVRGVIGDASTDIILKDFEEDYLKKTISGIASEDPTEALRILDTEGVRSSFSDSKGFKTFKTAIENNAINVNENAARREVLEAMKATNGIFAETSKRSMSYAELQTAGEKAGWSEAAQNYFNKANGFTKGGPKLDATGKIQAKANVINKLVEAGNLENIEPEDIQGVQDTIFEAMSEGAMTQTEGADLIAQLVEPTIEGREAQLDDFAAGNWNPFSKNVGFLGIEDFFEDEVEIEDAEGSISQALNVTNKVNLYSFYLRALQEEGAKQISTENPNGVRMGDIPDLENSREIYVKAQDIAISRFKADTTPLRLKSGIPTTQIQLLLANPDASESFDEIYGLGAANRILGR